MEIIFAIEKKLRFKKPITIQTADSVVVERIVDHIDSIFAGFFL